MRFRKEQVAVTPDIQQMFYCFVVGDHCDYLWFLWYRDNDSSKDIVEYMMWVFRNSPSLAVATYFSEGLLREDKSGTGQTPDTLCNISSMWMMDLFPYQRRRKQFPWWREHKPLFQNQIWGFIRLFQMVRMSGEQFQSKTMQKQHGLSWVQELFLHNAVWVQNGNLLQIHSLFTPFTRRGVLSTVNSLFNPLGFVAPMSKKSCHPRIAMCDDTVYTIKQLGYSTSITSSMERLQ